MFSREFIGLFVAFTIGVLASSVRYEREQSILMRDAEHAYHEGYLDGRIDAEIAAEHARK